MVGFRKPKERIIRHPLLITLSKTVGARLPLHRKDRV